METMLMRSGMIQTISVTKDRTSYSTPEEISSVFYEHFISIADNSIHNTINTKPDLASLVDFVNRTKGGKVVTPLNSVYLQFYSAKFYKSSKRMKSLPPNVATGLNGISSPLLKLFAPAVAPSLVKVKCSIINCICPRLQMLLRSLGTA